MTIMGKRNFDNISKHTSADNSVTTTTVVSVEIDLSLPRGFIAKLWRIFMTAVITAVTDTDGNLVNCQAALLRDPDDITTTQIDNDPETDVLAQYNASVVVLAAAAGTVLAWLQQQDIIIPEHIDVITARNLRWNSILSGAVGTVISKVDIDYTLEEVTDDTILNLLDIL